MRAVESRTSGSTVTFLERSCELPETSETRPIGRPCGYLPPRPLVTTVSPTLIAACDSAKSAAAHLSGQEPPKHPDTEQTLDEMCISLFAVITATVQ